MPEASVDPVVMAAATVLRLQGIVSREVPPTEAAVVTIGVLQAGTKENVIPDEAIIKLNVRTFDEGVRKLRACGDRADRECRSRSLGCAEKTRRLRRWTAIPSTTNDPDATSESSMRFARISLLTGSGDHADDGERGLRVVRSRVARSVGLLVRRGSGS